MSILGKFENFEVKQTDRISKDDEVWLEKWQKLYEDALQYYSRVYALYREASAGYLKSDQELFGSYSVVWVNDLDVIKRVNDLQINFASRIYWYFEEKYKVNLESRTAEEKEKYNRSYNLSDVEITEKFKKRKYNDILEDIINQLGGMGFVDLATKQLKDKMKNVCYNKYHDKWDIEIKGSTLKYSGYGSVSETWHGKWRLYKCEFVKLLPEVMSMFIYGHVTRLIGLDFFYSYDIELEEYQLKEGIQFSSGLRIAGIKFFKNGRIDIKFATPEDAREFAREWCGYTLI